jgi:hypothetical protein
MPVASIQPIWFAKSKNKNRAIESPTRIPNAFTILFDLPWSLNMNTSAEPKLAKISANAIMTIHFINSTIPLRFL